MDDLATRLAKARHAIETEWTSLHAFATPAHDPLMIAIPRADDCRSLQVTEFRANDITENARQRRWPPPI